MNDRCRKCHFLTHSCAELGKTLVPCSVKLENFKQFFHPLANGLLVQPHHSRIEGQKLVCVKLIKECQTFRHHADPTLQLA